MPHSIYSHHPVFAPLTGADEQVCARCGAPLSSFADIFIDAFPAKNGNGISIAELLDRAFPEPICDRCGSRAPFCTKIEFRDRMDTLIRGMLSIKKTGKNSYQPGIPGDWVSHESWEIWCGKPYEEQRTLFFRCLALHHLVTQGNENPSVEKIDALAGRLVLSPDTSCDEERLKYIILDDNQPLTNPSEQ